LKWGTRLQTVSPVKAETLTGSVEEMAARMLPRMAKEFFDRGTRAASPSGSTDEFHRFRLAAEKFRYTLELFAPVYGPALGDGLEQIRTVQALLGGINDCATVRKMLSQFKGIEKADAGLKKTQAKKVERHLP
jgi:CHAD domain-containing protein